MNKKDVKKMKTRKGIRSLRQKNKKRKEDLQKLSDRKQARVREVLAI